MKNNLTPQKLVLYISLVLSPVITLLIFALSHLEVQSLLFYTIILITSFAAVYLLLYYAVEQFIYTKIRLIYRRIYPHRVSREKQNSISMEEDIVDKVNQEVTSWVQSNTNELEQLKKAEVFRREFLANVSHELKTPIFSIQGYIHTLLDGGLEDEHINLLYLEKASKSLERLCTIVDDLEAISRLESGELLIEGRRFDITELTREVFESLEIKARERKIRLEFKDNTASRALYVEADKDLVRQVLVNLIVNSIKYGKYEGITSVGLYDIDDTILLEVSDNGIGIDEKHLPRLFERFYRVDKSRSREQGGTGLGLSIVKHIIEAHGQSIDVRSAPGEGSTFSFTLKKG